jgi:hypothetical protein
MILDLLHDIDVGLGIYCMTFTWTLNLPPAIEPDLEFTT